MGTDVMKLKVAFRNSVNAPNNAWTPTDGKLEQR